MHLFCERLATVLLQLDDGFYGESRPPTIGTRSAFIPVYLEGMSI